MRCSRCRRTRKITAAGRAAAEGAAIARHARRRLPARLARSRHPRRRQSAGRGAVRPHQGGRLRALPADAGGGGAEPEGRHRRAGRRPLVAADHHRHAGADPGGLRRRPAGAARRSTAGSPTSRTSARSTPSAPSWSTASARCRRRSSTCCKIVAIKALCRRANVEKIDAGPKGAVLSFRDNAFANPDGLVAYIARAGRRRAGAARHEGRVLRRLGEAGAAAARHHGGVAQSRADRRAGQGGVGRPGLNSVYKRDSRGRIDGRFPSNTGAAWKSAVLPQRRTSERICGNRAFRGVPTLRPPSGRPLIRQTTRRME